MTEQPFPSEQHLQHLEKLRRLLDFAKDQVEMAGEALPQDRPSLIHQRFAILSLSVKCASKAWELYADCLEETVIHQQEEETNTTRKEER